MSATLALAEQPLALVQAANEDPDIKSLTEAYAAMEVLETQLWIQKHVRPDETFFVLHNQGPSAFGKGTDLDFSWGIRPNRDQSTCRYLETLYLGRCLYQLFSGQRYVLLEKQPGAVGEAGGFGTVVPPDQQGIQAHQALERMVL
ncbi:hypothetical protein OPQ81_002359 [Rhizoctonia solani]|nr:hypothetical protein OPQ81_002359 [Rhizoctonia solani]